MGIDSHMVMVSNKLKGHLMAATCTLSHLDTLVHMGFVDWLLCHLMGSSCHFLCENRDRFVAYTESKLVPIDNEFHF